MKLKGKLMEYATAFKKLTNVDFNEIVVYKSCLF